MKGEFRLVNPDAAIATMTVEMTVYEWKMIRQALENTTKSHSCMWSLVYIIRDLVDKAEAEFSSKGETS